MVKTRAALSYVTGARWDIADQPWKVEELDIVAVGPRDVLVRLPSSGVCHTDLHIVTGDMVPGMLPMIGGHEGAGVVQDVGAEVRDIGPGDHVVLSLVPRCGECRYCKMGRSNLCDLIAVVLSGMQPDGLVRYRNDRGEPVGQWAFLGTFAEYVVVPRTNIVKIDPGVNLEHVAMIGCAVTTGFGAAVDKADVRVGDSVMVWGCGGVGLAAVQGAVVAGASEIFAVDTNDLKLAKARQFGATATFNPRRDRSPNPHRDETAEKVMERTGWAGVDSAILAVDYVTPELVGVALSAVRRGGTLVVAGVANPAHRTIDVMPAELTLSEKTVAGCVYGGGNPAIDIPRNIKLYQTGQLRLAEMISNVYPVEEVNQAFEDLLAGKNIKSTVVF